MNKEDKPVTSLKANNLVVLFLPEHFVKMEKQVSEAPAGAEILPSVISSCDSKDSLSSDSFDDKILDDESA